MGGVRIYQLHPHKIFFVLVLRVTRTRRERIELGVFQEHHGVRLHRWRVEELSGFDDHTAYRRVLTTRVSPHVFESSPDEIAEVRVVLVVVVRAHCAGFRGDAKDAVKVSLGEFFNDAARSIFDALGRSPSIRSGVGCCSRCCGLHEPRLAGPGMS